MLVCVYANAVKGSHVRSLLLSQLSLGLSYLSSVIQCLNLAHLTYIALNLDVSGLVSNNSSMQL